MTTSKSGKGTRIILLLLILGVGVWTAAMGTTAYAAVTFKNVSYTSDSNAKSLVFKAKGMQGACCQPGVPERKSGKADLTVLPNSDKLARIAYYYGEKKGWWKPYSNKESSDRVKFMLQYANVGRDQFIKMHLKYDRKEFVNKIADEAKKNINAIPASLKKAPGNFVICFCDTGSGNQNFVVWELTPPTKVKLTKASSDTAANMLKAYTKKGIQYTVYSAKAQKDANKVGVLTCKADGTTNTLSELAAKTTYYIKETKTNEYFTMDKSWHTVKTGSKKNSVKSVTLKDDPVKVPVTLVKRIDGEPLPDETFSVRLTNTENTSLNYTVELKGDGTPSEIKVLAGSYKVKEIMTEEQATKYIGLSGIQTIQVGIDGTLTADGAAADSVVIENRPVRNTLQVVKKTGDDGPLDGFQFRVTGTLCNEGTLTEEHLLAAADPEAELEEEMKQNYTVTDWSADPSDIAAINEAAKERKTGDHTVHIYGTAVTQDTDEQGNTLPAVSLKATVGLRLEHVEYDEEKERYQAGFITDERETIGDGVTGRPVEWKGSATSYRDPVDGKDHSILTTDQAGNGIWNNQVGILPAFPGSYTVEEVLTDEQAKLYKQPKMQTKEIRKNTDGSNEPVVFTFENEPKWTPVTLQKTCEDGEIEGIEFRLTGMDVRQEAIDRIGVTDAQGKIEFGELYGGEYVIEETGFDSQRYRNKYPLEGYQNPARRIIITGEETDPVKVVFENPLITELYLTKVDRDSGMFLEDAMFELLEEDGSLAARFRLIKSEDGSADIDMLTAKEDITGTIMGSTAGDQSEEGTEDDGEADEDDGFNFAVLQGLKVGERYTLKEVTPPSGYSMFHVEEFTFEDRMQLVIENAAPKIATTAVDRDTGLHQADPGKNVTIVDTVKYENLTGGREYEMRGRLVYKPKDNGTDFVNDGAEPEAVVIDGREVTATKTFVAAKEGAGTVELEFTFAGQALAGRRVVVQEELYDPALEGEKQFLAAHKDLSAESQTVDFTKLRTTATDKESGLHTACAVKQAVIVDKVEYENLAAGKEYKIRGVLMDRATGQPIRVNGEKITASTRFAIPAGEEIHEENGDGSTDSRSGASDDGHDKLRRVSGSTELEFRFDATDLQGVSLVAFEELWTEGKVIGRHKDLTDEEQTVTFPGIGTKADRPSTNVVRDTIAYNGLIPGRTYVMSGVLVRKETGKPIEGTISEKEFTPHKAEGTMSLCFNVDAKAFGNEDIVIFEECYTVVPVENGEKAVLVASHKDLNCKDQTVSFAKPPKTGDDPPWIPGMLAVVSAAAIICLVRRRRMRRV